MNGSTIIIIILVLLILCCCSLIGGLYYHGSFTKLSNGIYTITVSGGRDNCAKLLGASSCTTDNNISIYENDLSDFQHFKIKWKVGSENIYYISSVGRSTCKNYLSFKKCDLNNYFKSNDLVFDELGEIDKQYQEWKLITVDGLINTFNIIPINDRGKCGNFLNIGSCGTNKLSFWPADDMSGKQRFIFNNIGFSF